ncbi:hypothetical protein EK904_004219 [Melospiza melodia maxima]|nr:hypothetical protein EK904_004219 [Melospiza melodia maxima]
MQSLPVREQEHWWVWQSHDGTRSNRDTRELEVNCSRSEVLEGYPALKTHGACSFPEWETEDFHLLTTTNNSRYLFNIQYCNQKEIMR